MYCSLVKEMLRKALWSHFLSLFNLIKMTL